MTYICNIQASNEELLKQVAKLSAQLVEANKYTANLEKSVIDLQAKVSDAQARFAIFKAVVALGDID